MKDELVAKLKEAGINASLVHKIQDETSVDILPLNNCTIVDDGYNDAKSLEMYLMPPSNEFTGLKVGEPTIILPNGRPTSRGKVSSVFVDYIKTAQSDRTDTKSLMGIANSLKEIAKQVDVTPFIPDIVLTNMMIKGSGVGYEAISDTIREKGYSPIEADFSRWYHNSKHIVAPKGGRSISKPTMDSND